MEESQTIGPRFLEPDNTQNKMLMRSYVKYYEDVFCVSTINVTTPEPDEKQYSDTTVWSFYTPQAGLGTMLASYLGAKDSIAKHILVCQQLHDSGTLGLE